MDRRTVAILIASTMVAGCSVVGASPSTGGSGTGDASRTPFVSPEVRQSPSPSSSAEASPFTTWSPPPVPTVSGDDVYSVSKAISARDAGTLGSRTIDVGGYWSATGFAFPCGPAPDHTLNKLEIWCDGRTYGITERFEMAMTTISNGMATSFVPAAGPLLQPYVPDDLASRLFSTEPNGPAPIVVAGHFNDPGAADCVAAVRETCRKTFVLESILAYDPASAPTLPPSPIPTPFPSPAPSGLFPATQCSGDVAYSFIGWTTADALNATVAFEGHAWAAVTAEVVPLGEWNADPNVPGHFNLAMGRRVCLSFDMLGGGIAFSVVKGTEYRLWDDGRRTTSDEFGPGSGDPSLPPAGTAPPLPKGVAVAMRGSGLADLAATIRDWSGELRAARPATNDELALPGAETGNEHNAAALVLPNDPRSVLIVMAECGSDRSVTVTVTQDRMSVLLLAASRTDCGQPGARRGAVLTFRSDVPSDITAFAGL